MTKGLTREGWAYLVVVNDWFTKKILGAFVADRSRASDWLEAVNEAVCRQFPSLSVIFLALPTVIALA